MGIINRVIERAKQITSDILSAPYAAVKGAEGSNADATRKAVRLARETKGVPISPEAAGNGDKFSQDVIMARDTAAQAKADVAKRKKKSS